MPEHSSHLDGPSPEHLNVGPVLDPIPGFPFTAESPIRRYAEPASALLVPYIAGLTILSDPIAAAVDKHSTFTTEPWSRFIGTGAAAVKLVFGGHDESLATAQRLWSFHGTVQGTHEGVRYSANDSDQQVWAIASVFDGFKKSDRWTDPLTRDQQAGVYEGMKIFSKMFGIKDGLMPPDLDAFDQYWEDKITGDEILRTAVSRRMAQTVFRYEGKQVPKWLGTIGQAIWITSLDPRLQERADLVPTEKDMRVARRVDATMQQTYAKIPKSAREQALPAYFATRRRIKPLVDRISPPRT